MGRLRVTPRVYGPKLEGRAGRRHAPRELLPCLLPVDRPENDAWGGLEVSRSVRSRVLRRGQRGMMINDAVSSLNSLYGNNAQPSGTSTAQIACIDRLRGCVGSMGPPPADTSADTSFVALCGSRAGYDAQPCQSVPLRLEKLSLPPCLDRLADGGDVLVGPMKSTWVDWRSHLLNDAKTAKLERSSLGLVAPYSDPELLRRPRRYAKVGARVN